MDESVAYSYERELRQLADRLDAMQEKRAEKRYNFELPPPWRIQVTVDGAGGLHALTIPPGTLAGGPAAMSGLGKAVTDAINGARRRAVLNTRDELAQLIGGERADAAIGTRPLDGLIGQYEAAEKDGALPPPSQQEAAVQVERPTPPAAPKPPPRPSPSDLDNEEDYFEALSEGGLYT